MANKRLVIFRGFFFFITGFVLCLIVLSSSSIQNVLNNIAVQVVMNCCNEDNTESHNNYSVISQTFQHVVKPRNNMGSIQKRIIVPLRTNHHKPKAIKEYVAPISVAPAKTERIASASTMQVDVAKCPASFSSWYHSKSRYNYNISPEVIAFTKKSCKKPSINKCIAPSQVGSLLVHKDRVSFDWLYQNELQFVKYGGWWSPKDCTENHHTAIIIPFRDRYEHLQVLLRQLHPILERQHLHYRIFVIEQNDNYTFNRGKLMNVGFREAQKYFPYSCFVFHDVDLIPEDDRISYGCKYSPMHLSVAVNKFNYVLPYADIFGGIEMFLTKDYEKVNGFSNSFWKWGGEDDNLFNRLESNQLSIHRQSVSIARYTMLTHKNNDIRSESTERNAFLRQSYAFNKHDGLNSLQYDVDDTEQKQLYTIIKVDLRRDKDKRFGVEGL